MFESEWKFKCLKERKKNQQLININKEKKKAILEKLKILEEDIKDIMYIYKDDLK